MVVVVVVGFVVCFIISYTIKTIFKRGSIDQLAEERKKHSPLYVDSNFVCRSPFHPSLILHPFIFSHFNLSTIRKYRIARKEGVEKRKRMAQKKIK